MEEMELYSYDLYKKCRIYIYKDGNKYSADIYWHDGLVTEGLCFTDPDNLLDICKDHTDMMMAKEDM